MKYKTLIALIFLGVTNLSSALNSNDQCLSDLANYFQKTGYTDNSIAYYTGTTTDGSGDTVYTFFSLGLHNIGDADLAGDCQMVPDRSSNLKIGICSFGGNAVASCTENQSSPSSPVSYIVSFSASGMSGSATFVDGKSPNNIQAKFTDVNGVTYYNGTLCFSPGSDDNYCPAGSK